MPAVNGLDRIAEILGVALDDDDEWAYLLEPGGHTYELAEALLNAMGTISNVEIVAGVPNEQGEHRHCRVSCAGTVCMAPTLSEAILRCARALTREWRRRY